MAYKLIVTDHADELIDRLAGYLVDKLKNTDAAKHFLNELEDVYSHLEDNPFMFAESPDKNLAKRGYRIALFHSMSYRVVFRVDKQKVYIVGIYHDLEDYGNKVID